MPETIKLLAAENMAFLIVSRKMDFVREVSHRVVFMAEGRIQEIGPPAQIADAPQLGRTKAFTGRIARTAHSAYVRLR